MLSHKDFIKQCYQNHIFVAPSQTDMKNGESEGGAPTVILEAMSTGMPVIGSNHADIPNIITDGRNGIIFEENWFNSMFLSDRYLASVKTIINLDISDGCKLNGNPILIHLYVSATCDPKKGRITIKMIKTYRI